MMRQQNQQPITGDRATKLRELAAQAAQGADWEQSEILNECADWIIRLEAQNQAFNKIFKNGLVVQINNYKKRFFGKIDR